MENNGFDSIQNANEFLQKTVCAATGTEKPKKGRFKTTVAASLAVALIGGSSGFLGAYLGSEALSKNSPLKLPEANMASESLNDEVLLASDTLAKNTNSKEMTPAELFEHVNDTVVGIKLYENNTSSFRRQADTEGSLVGSGVIFATDGYVLTNYHVITEYEKISVLVNDYDNPKEVYEYEAEIVGKDNFTDLAVLKIKRDETFKAAPIGNSSTLKVGQFIAAIGFPLGLEKSMTWGIVSGLNREVDAGGFELSSIQIDAAVNMGNSGGPLFDMYGNVVGIVNKKLVYDNLVENMGFAITIDEAKPVINDLLEHGSVTSRPVIGIRTQELNEYTAVTYGTDVTKGLLVVYVNPNAPAVANGLSIGDIIIKVNDVEIGSVLDVQTQTKNLKVGDTIKVTVVRYNEFGQKSEQVLTIELTSSEVVE